MSETILDDFKTQSETNDDNYYLAYFGRQGEYYITRFRQLQSGRKFTFNIGSFLAGLFWLLYRKLYLQFVIVFCVLFGSSFIETFAYELLSVSIPAQQIIGLGINIAWLIAFAFLGNYLYLKQAEKNVNHILSSTTNEEERLERLSKKGGTSNSPFYLIVILIILFFMFDIPSILFRYSV